MRLFVLMAILLPSLSFAKLNVGPEFTCMAEFPTTTFYVKSNGSEAEPKTELRVVHHFGAAATPIFNGVVTAFDLPRLQQKANFLKKLGDAFTVQFRTEKCETSGPGLYSCASTEPIEINGIDIRSYSFVTRVIETKVYEYTFKSHQVNFSFVHDGMSHDISMVYSPDECKFK